jgi:hypothetical protein
MRRGTLIIIVALFLIITVAALAQILIASGDRSPLEGPTSPGQLPSLTGTPNP